GRGAPGGGSSAPPSGGTPAPPKPDKPKLPKVGKPPPLPKPKPPSLPAGKGKPGAPSDKEGDGEGEGHQFGDAAKMPAFPPPVDWGKTSPKTTSNEQGLPRPPFFPHNEKKINKDILPTDPELVDLLRWMSTMFPYRDLPAPEHEFDDLDVSFWGFWPKWGFVIQKAPDFFEPAV